MQSIQLVPQTSSQCWYYTGKGLWSIVRPTEQAGVSFVILTQKRITGCGQPGFPVQVLRIRLNHHQDRDFSAEELVIPTSSSCTVVKGSLWLCSLDCLSTLVLRTAESSEHLWTFSFCQAVHWVADLVSEPKGWIRRRVRIVKKQLPPTCLLRNWSNSSYFPRNP